MTTTTIIEGLDQVAGALTKARDALSADPDASPVTTAVVDEFARKTDKARAAGNRDAVIELEQAGDSASPAAPHGPPSNRARFRYLRCAKRVFVPPNCARQVAPTEGSNPPEDHSVRSVMV
jgi:hypothetical protein